MSNIKYLRRRAKLTQTEVASAIGVTQGTVSQWENGLSWPRPNKMKAIAQLYCCTLEELYEAQTSDHSVNNSIADIKDVV